MDDPALESDRHYSALRGLARLNRWTFVADMLWRRIKPLSRSADRPIRILDIATGAGDIPIALWRRAGRSQGSITIEGCDISPRAVEFATQRAAQAGAWVKFFRHDILAHDLPSDYDVVVSSLFLHHLSDSEAVVLLTRMRESAGQLAIVSDLVRGRSSYLMTLLGTRVLSRSDVVHTDGPLSVRAAFTRDEVLALAGAAGWNGCTIQRTWPCRLLLQWRRTVEAT